MIIKMNECLIKYEVIDGIGSVAEIDIKPCCSKLCEESIKDELANHMHNEDDFVKHVNTLFPCECKAKLKLNRVLKKYKD